MSKLVRELREQVVVQEITRTELKPPPLYQVVLLNDDYTPMDFVVEVLLRYFMMHTELAKRIMWQVHMEGRGVCGVFTRDIAETKVSQVNAYARMNEHPLLCKMEKT